MHNLSINSIENLEVNILKYLLIKKVCDINITCNHLILVEQNIICNLTVISNGEDFLVNIDFKDSDQRDLIINDKTVQLIKNYSTVNEFNITVKIMNNTLSNFFLIHGLLLYIKKDLIFNINYYIFLKKAYQVILICPEYILVNNPFTCEITASSLGDILIIALDFGDKDLRQLTMKDNSMTIQKTYNITGNFNITAISTNTSMSVFEKINGNLKK